MSLNEVLHHASMTKLREAIEKRAGFWDNFVKAVSIGNIGKQMGEGLLAAGSAAAVTGLGVAAKKGFDYLREKVEKPQAYKAMMETTPGLAKKDPKAVQSTFNTLYGLNRTMAKDPLVAGSFVGKTVERAEIGGEAGAYVDPQTVKTLMDAARRSDEPIMEAWSSGAQRPDIYKMMGGMGKASSAKLQRFTDQLARPRGK